MTFALYMLMFSWCVYVMSILLLSMTFQQTVYSLGSHIKMKYIYEDNAQIQKEPHQKLSFQSVFMYKVEL